ALTDLGDRLADQVGQVPAHRLEQRHPRDGDAGLRPAVDHELEHRHALLSAEGALEVGAEGVADGHRGALRAGGAGRGDARVHRGDLLGLRAVVVAPREGVAHLDVARGQPAAAAHVEVGVPAIGALEAGLVEEGRGVGDAWLRDESLG
ncbi:MAG: hypothetical protein ACK56I_27430, partial [bacterium]